MADVQYAFSASVCLPVPCTNATPVLAMAVDAASPMTRPRMILRTCCSLPLCEEVARIVVFPGALLPSPAIDANSGSGTAASRVPPQREAGWTLNARSSAVKHVFQTLVGRAAAGVFAASGVEYGLRLRTEGYRVFVLRTRNPPPSIRTRCWLHSKRDER